MHWPVCRLCNFRRAAPPPTNMARQSAPPATCTQAQVASGGWAVHLRVGGFILSLACVRACYLLIHCAQQSWGSQEFEHGDPILVKIGIFRGPSPREKPRDLSLKKYRLAILSTYIQTIRIWRISTHLALWLHASGCIHISPDMNIFANTLKTEIPFSAVCSA